MPPYNSRFPMKYLSVLGSTGSIGRSALDVVEAFPDRYRVVALAAGRSVEKLAEQVARHRPELVAVAGREEARKLKALLPAGVSARIVTGDEGLEEAAAHEKADVVVGGLVGALGLRSAYAAAAAGKRLALANKETLVVAGELILSVAARSGAEIVPVDSEHCAIHQALRCGDARGSRAAGADRLGRALPAAGPPHLRHDHRRRRARAPDLEDGPEDHGGLGDDDEQGAGDHRGALPLRARRPRRSTS